MNTNTQIDKIDKVLSKISGKEMKAFVWQYAATHEDFATALVEKYWKLIIALKQYRLYHSNDTASLAWLQASLFTWLAIPV